MILLMDQFTTFTAIKTSSSSSSLSPNNRNHRRRKSTSSLHRFAAFIIVYILLCLEVGTVRVHAIAAPRSSEAADSNIQCVGLNIDFARVRKLNNRDANLITSPSEGRSFSFLQSSRVNMMPRKGGGGKNKVRDRIRFQERIQNVKIHGAVVIVLLEECPDGEVCAQSISSLDGNTFMEVDVPEGYQPTHTEDDAKKALAKQFGTKQSDVGELSLEVFPTEFGDFLVFIGEVFVEDEVDGSPQLYDVIIEAHTLTVIQQCSRIGTSVNMLSDTVVETEIRSSGENNNDSNFDSDLVFDRHRLLLRQNHRALANSLNCPEEFGTCQALAQATNTGDLTWTNNLVDCPISTLYLDDNGRTTKCISDTSGVHYAPGPVEDLHWGGSYDCASTTDICRMAPLPNCPNALSDVQFAAVQTLTYYRDYLGLKGGLSLDSENPVPLQAYVHYGDQYCNAFFRRASNAVYFGDCDCERRRPFPSVDIVAHEISHGVTEFTSGLSHIYQAGALNEAFADIAAVAIEFLVDDEPDFTVGENLTPAGSPLRNMKDPSADGKSIASVCDYHRDVSAHHASGPVNLAYATAVQLCANNECSGDESNLKDCAVLLSTSFMYANINALSPLSGYLDAASATCKLVTEYLGSDLAIITTTSHMQCSADQLEDFIRTGWCSVNVVLDQGCEASYSCGDGYCGSGGDGIEPEAPGVFTLVADSIWDMISVLFPRL